MPAYRAAASLDPGSLDAQLGLGSSLRMSGLYEAAVPAYRAAASLDPGSINAYEGLGFALDGAGRHEGGREFHRRAVAMRGIGEWQHDGR